MYENIDDNGRIVKCRKKQQCEWCGIIIQKEEKAIIRVYKFEGDFNSSYQHPECYEAMRESFKQNLVDSDGSFNSCEQSRGALIGDD
uniref:PARP-type domain-containing protein n=1 Tax=viral metagenome TaxID=1070528 RepID=A0A6M3K8A4_9ZZZZ